MARGDRVALMLPNVPQYLVAAAAILRTGCVVVNLDPRCTQRELELQLKDSGARAIVALDNHAATLQQVPDVQPAQKIVPTALGDMLGPLRRALANHAGRHGRQRVPPFQIPGAVRFNEALARGRRLALTEPRLGPDDIALLQYTSGTSGTTAPGRAAVLLHRNLVANLLQSWAWVLPALNKLPRTLQWVTVCALPLTTSSASAPRCCWRCAWAAAACSSPTRTTPRRC